MGGGGGVAVLVLVVVVVVAVWVVVVVAVVYTGLFKADSFHMYRILKQNPLSRVFSLLQNATMTKVHDDHKVPEMNGTSASRTC